MACWLAVLVLPKDCARNMQHDKRPCASKKTVSTDEIFRLNWSESDIRQHVDAFSDTVHQPGRSGPSSFGFQDAKLGDSQIEMIRSGTAKSHLRGLHHVAHNILGAFCCDKVPLFDGSPGIARVLLTLCRGTQDEGEGRMANANPTSCG